MNIKFLTIRTIFENDNASIESIAHLFTVKKEEVEAAIKEAINEGFIEKKGHFLITKKGLLYLEEYKVDNAVILACGKGMRLAPLTFDTPKCFIRIKGQKMIERQIEQLLTAGIKNITIMTGFMSEKFEYLKNKYNIKLIYNEEYDNKNTLATLYKARDLFIDKNTYVCVSDVYMVDNIYHKYECESFYSGTFLHNLDKEWQYVVDKDLRISGVLDGGVDEYAMMGPAFMTKDFSKKLIPMIEEAYKTPGTEQYYWENVLVENFDSLPPMYLYKQVKGSMYEFDKLEDIRLFDENIKTGSFSFSFVADAFNVEEKNIKDIKCIKEGMTNRSYTFNIDGKSERYICRVPGIGTNFFINRINEKSVYKELSPHNITEKVLAFDDDGVKISEFFDDAKVTDVNNENELKDAMTLYRRFHNLGCKVKVSTDPEDKNNEYLNIMKKYNLSSDKFEGFDKAIIELKKLNDYKNSFNRNKTLIHGDANPGNVLYTKNGMRLIDFEYAGMADPLVDIALFGIYVEFDIDKTLKLFDYYNDINHKIKINDSLDNSDNVTKNIAMENISIEDAKKLIVTYMALSAFWCVVWVICREGLANADYHEYGKKMYKIFNTCVEYLKNA